MNITTDEQATKLFQEYRFSEKLNTKIKQQFPEEDAQFYESLISYISKQVRLIVLKKEDASISKLESDFKKLFRDNEIDQVRQLTFWIKQTLESFHQMRMPQSILSNIKKAQNQNNNSNPGSNNNKSNNISSNTNNNNSDSHKRKPSKDQYKQTQENEEKPKKNQLQNNNSSSKQDDQPQSIMHRIKLKQQGQKVLELKPSIPTTQKVIQLPKTEAKNQKIIQKQKQKLDNIEQHKQSAQQEYKDKKQQHQQPISKYNNKNKNIKEGEEEGQQKTEQDEEQQDQEPGATDEQKKKIRCKYFPNCKNQETCPFHHPTEKCSHFPSCKFGSQCLNIHPDCTYGLNCTRPDCFYQHPPGLKRFSYNQMYMQGFNPYNKMMMPMYSKQSMKPKVKLAQGPAKKQSAEISTK